MKSEGRRSGRSSRNAKLPWLKAYSTPSRVNLHAKFTRRGLIIAFAVVATLIGSTLALGAESGWWFLNSNGNTSLPTPAPVGDVVTVTTGTWDNQKWALTAYRTESNKVCFAVTPGSLENSSGQNAVMSCGAIGELGITALYSPRQGIFPAYLAGPVVSSANRVHIKLDSGDSVDTDTIAAPSLPYRFFVATLPCNAAPVEATGFDDQGSVVARIEIPVVGNPSERSATTNGCN
jgi:hypothetical protein